VAAAWAVLLAACQDDNDAHERLLEDYISRIARVTEADARVAEAGALPPYPPHRALALEIPRSTIDVFELFELHGCDMGALVGFRNSPLGRLQTASQRLGYEAAWLEASERCADAGDWLEELRTGKHERLPALFWNATFAADEMRVALGASAPPANGDLADIVRGLNDSLDRAMQGGFEIDELERLLGRLKQGSWLGPARADWSRWRRYLGVASRMLESAGPTVCLNRLPTPRTSRLQNVFHKLYVQQIQPVLAARLGRHEGWVAEIERLSERLRAVQPPAWRAWFADVVSPDDDASEWRRTRRAVVAHAKAWQALFAHCHIEPVSGLRQD
jgi:hypothetical protein